MRRAAGPHSDIATLQTSAVGFESLGVDHPLPYRRPQRVAGCRCGLVRHRCPARPIDRHRTGRDPRQGLAGRPRYDRLVADERRRGRLLIGFTVAVGLVLLAMPGFRTGRSFDGVRQETLSGRFIIVARLLTGAETQIMHHAGAEYVEASVLAVLVNLAIGGIIALASLSVLRTDFSWRGGAALTAALTYAVLLASPLLSAQFILWPIPFVALVGSRRGQILLTFAAALSVALSRCGHRRGCGGTPVGLPATWCC